MIVESFDLILQIDCLPYWQSWLLRSFGSKNQFVLHFSFSPFNIEIFFVFSFSQSSGWFIDNFMFLCFSIVVRQREIDWGLLLAIEVGNTMWTRYKASDFDVCRVIYDWFRSRLGFETPASDNWEQQGRDRSRGVYFVQKLYNCPKTRQGMVKILKLPPICMLCAMEYLILPILCP